MDVLDGMRAFRAVVDTGSFVAGGRALGLSTAWVSKRVAQLEEHLGTQLLARTTRRLSLTDAGRLYLEHCRRLLDDLDEAERSVGSLQASPRGRLRVTAPMSLGLTRLAKLLPAFSARYPEVELDVYFNDRYVDVVNEGFDVAVRVGAALDDSSLIARTLGRGRRVLVASPDYLGARGVPRRPAELSQHACLRYSLHAAPSRWSFVGPRGEVSVQVGGPLQLNNSVALATAAVLGAGLLLAPDFVVADDLTAGRLRRVLPRYEPSGYTMFAVSPPTRFVTPKVRAFVDFLVERLARPG
ncbi:MAG: LysR substrate-binding domain-containing protein [Myxococcaceae bacterium]|nr:LysR substrate-binding domain-containing protein [Myxococcaceae bacterium]